MGTFSGLGSLVGSCGLLLSLAALALGCGGGVQSVAEANRVFYTKEALDPATLRGHEVRYPPLDAKPPEAYTKYLGYTVLDGRLHISRPASWRIKAASRRPGLRYIKYTSPREYIFAIYEWPEFPETPWLDVIRGYEEQLKSSKAKILDGRVPVAIGNGQGRAFTVLRKVRAPVRPYESHAREYLVRNDHRVVVVQVVHQGKDLKDDSPELMRVLDTLELVHLVANGKALLAIATGGHAPLYRAGQLALGLR